MRQNPIGSSSITAKGAIGPAGPSGASPAGTHGASGAVGPTGATGLTGYHVVIGTAGYSDLSNLKVALSEKEETAWGQWFPRILTIGGLIGPTGATGTPAGKTIDGVALFKEISGMSSEGLTFWFKGISAEGSLSLYTSENSIGISGDMVYQRATFSESDLKTNKFAYISSGDTVNSSGLTFDVGGTGGILFDNSITLDVEENITSIYPINILDVVGITGAPCIDGCPGGTAGGGVGIQLEVDKGSIIKLSTPMGIRGFTGDFVNSELFGFTMILEGNDLWDWPTNVQFIEENVFFTCGSDVINFITDDGGVTWNATVAAVGYGISPGDCDSIINLGSCCYVDDYNNQQCIEYTTFGICNDKNQSSWNSLKPCSENCGATAEGICCSQGVCIQGQGLAECNYFGGNFWNNYHYKESLTENNTMYMEKLEVPIPIECGGRYPCLEENINDESCVEGAGLINETSFSNNFCASSCDFISCCKDGVCIGDSVGTTRYGSISPAICRYVFGGVPVGGSNCRSVDCCDYSVVVGACCMEGVSECSHTTALVCSSMNGVFMGPGTDCTTDICCYSDAIGLCCLGEDQCNCCGTLLDHSNCCRNLTFSDCQSIGGYWDGEGYCNEDSHGNHDHADSCVCGHSDECGGGGGIGACCCGTTETHCLDGQSGNNCFNLGCRYVGDDTFCLPDMCPPIDPYPTDQEDDDSGGCGGCPPEHCCVNNVCDYCGDGTDNNSCVNNGDCEPIEPPGGGDLIYGIGQCCCGEPPVCKHCSLCDGDPVGGCCYNAGTPMATCGTARQSICQDAGGVFMGEGNSCSSNSCGVRPSTCCCCWGTLAIPGNVCVELYEAGSLPCAGGPHYMPAMLSCVSFYPQMGQKCGGHCSGQIPLDTGHGECSSGMNGANDFHCCSQTCHGQVSVCGCGGCCDGSSGQDCVKDFTCNCMNGLTGRHACGWHCCQEYQEACHTTCCGDEESCCVDTCCQDEDESCCSGSSYLGGTCCESGAMCCSGQLNSACNEVKPYCCDEGEVCCGTGCINPETTKCCGDCTPNSCGTHQCLQSEICCGNFCCGQDMGCVYYNGHAECYPTDLLEPTLHLCCDRYQCDSGNPDNPSECCGCCTDSGTSCYPPGPCWSGDPYAPRDWGGNNGGVDGKDWPQGLPQGPPEELLGYEPNLSCPADINHDGVVGITDVLTWVALFGETCNDDQGPGCMGDVNRDGVVDVADLLEIIDHWGPCADPQYQYLLQASDGSNNDYFGHSVALSNNAAVVGAWGEDSSGGFASGAAYIFRLEYGVWTEESKIVAVGTDPQIADAFGGYVDIHGDVALIAAHGDDEGGQNAGAVYVFRRDTSGLVPRWIQEIKILGDNPGDNLGGREGISVWGDSALVTSEEQTGVGYGHIYNYDGSNWIKEHTIVPFGGGGWGSGESSMSENLIAIGNAAASGTVWIWRFNGTEWVEEQRVSASDDIFGDNERFGHSVSIEGNILIVGAYEDNDNGDQSGSAYIFHFNGSEWIEEHKFIGRKAGDRFGTDVSVSGETVVVSSPYNNEQTGYARSFRRVSSNGGYIWIEEEMYTNITPRPDEFFGFSVSIDGDTVLIGSYGDAPPVNLRGQSSNNVVPQGTASVFHKSNTVNKNEIAFETDGYKTAMEAIRKSNRFTDEQRETILEALNPPKRDTKYKLPWSGECVYMNCGPDCEFKEC